MKSTAIEKVNVFVLSTEQFTDEGFWSDVLGVFKSQEEASKEMHERIKEWREYNGALADEYELDLDSENKMRYENENGDYVEWTISNFTL
jgi:hypothetical protein